MVHSIKPLAEIYTAKVVCLLLILRNMANCVTISIVDLFLSESKMIICQAPSKTKPACEVLADLAFFYPVVVNPTTKL